MQEVRCVSQVSTLVTALRRRGTISSKQRRRKQRPHTEADNGAEFEVRRDRQAEAQDENAERDKFVATGQTAPDRLQYAAHEKILDAIENILRIKVAGGLRGRRDDDAQKTRLGLRNETTIKKNT